MSTKKKNTAFSTHEYRVTQLGPDGKPMGSVVVVGSVEAFHKQQEIEAEGHGVIVRNLTTDSEEYRTGGDD